MTRGVCGIDLGTTNSCLAVVRGGSPEVVPIDGRQLVPSVISLDEDTCEILVGTRARNRAALFQELTVASVKRRMGAAERLRLGRRELAPEEVSAEILRYLTRHAEAALGEPVVEVVITVPAFFDDAQRRATIRAGELAGLEVLRIVNEPTAAALVYRRARRREVDAVAGRAAEGRMSDADDNVLVYDLGGGTFDVSVLRVDGDLYRTATCTGSERATATPGWAATTSTARSCACCWSEPVGPSWPTIGWRRRVSRTPPSAPRSSCQRRPSRRSWRRPSQPVWICARSSVGPTSRSCSSPISSAP